MKATSTILVGDCIEQLRTLDAGSVQCCVCSPPYWGLRDYGTATWEGGDAECDHSTPRSRGDDIKVGDKQGTSIGSRPNTQHICRSCGARRIDNQIGLEPTLDEFIAKLVEVFREVRRVLRDDGTLWLNMGDGYTGGNRGGGGDKQKSNVGSLLEPCRPVAGLPPKNLIGQPWRLAFALQADGAVSPETMDRVSRIIRALEADFDTWDAVPHNTRTEIERLQREYDDAQKGGWILRSDMPWVKRSAMPESATDRPCKALEYMFLLTKKPQYYFDMEAVRVAMVTSSVDRLRQDVESQDGSYRQPGKTNGPMKAVGDGIGRNFRNTDIFFESLKPPFGMIFCGDEPVGFDVTSEGFKGAHFATFPRKLVEPCLKAGTSARGCCPECGSPWRRVVEKERVKTRPGEDTKLAVAAGGIMFKDSDKKARYDYNSDIAGNRDPYRHVTTTTTLGWEQGCECNAGEPVPCTVTDIFSGAGTVGVVAKGMGLNFIGIELNPAYAEMARKRIENPEPVPVVENVPGQLEMFTQPDREPSD